MNLNEWVGNEYSFYLNFFRSNLFCSLYMNMEQISFERKSDGLHIRFDQNLCSSNYLKLTYVCVCVFVWLRFYSVISFNREKK